MPRRFTPVFFAALLLSSLATALLAQDKPTGTAPIAATATPAPAQAATPPEKVTLTEIADQSVKTDKLIEQMKQLAVQPLEFEELNDQLTLARDQVKELQANTQKLLQDNKTSLEQLRIIQSQWQFLRNQLASQQQKAKQRAISLESGLSQLTDEEARWEQIKSQLTGPTAIAQLSEDNKTQLHKVAGTLKSTRKLLTTPLQESLAITMEWQEQQDLVDENLMTIDHFQTSLRKQILTSIQAPLWEISPDEFRINDGTWDALRLQVTLARLYLIQFPSRAISVVLATLGMLVFLWRLRVRHTQMVSDQEGIHLQLPLIDRPLSTTVATSVALALMIYPSPPQIVQSVLSLLLFIPVVQLGLSRLPGDVRLLAWLVSIFFVINTLSVLTEAVPGLQRVWTVISAAISFFVCIHALRNLALSEDRESPSWKALRATLWFALIAAMIAMIAGIAGAATLAQFLITGVANSAYFGLCMVVLAGILGDLTVAALYLPYSTTSQLISHNRPMLVGRLGKAAIVICVLTWIHITLKQFLIAEPLWQFVSNALNRQLEIGNLAVSLGDVLAVGITVWLSFKLSQLLRFIFIEDIAPRAKLARGVPDAIATLMHYFIILAGFMFAISAAGIDVSKLAIMAGALGVGIGIGLQDVVNNFTSGLILLFEQHIKQADIIQCSTVNGRVLQIGLRSSVVRTFDGAEVIVPNGMLVSAQVINWTHSDQQRRITIPVGAAYGTDAQKVIDTLMAVAAADPDVLADPIPTAFFLRFGPSSMDFELRCWVNSGEILNDVTSRLCVSITRQFAAANIPIPFPQQDVYLRSLPEGFGKPMAP